MSTMVCHRAEQLIRHLTLCFVTSKLTGQWQDKTPQVMCPTVDGYLVIWINVTWLKNRKTLT